MPWDKRLLRGTVVHARTLDDGSLDVGADGRVDVRYKLDEAAKIYRAAGRNLIEVADANAPAVTPARGAARALAEPDDGHRPAVALVRAAPPPTRAAAVAEDVVGGALGRTASPRRVHHTGATTGPVADGDVVIYTDGACTGNPGPMGIGVVIKRGPSGRRREEIGEYLGAGTNNIAELTAIERALDALGPGDRGQRVLVHADSAYAIGVVSGAMRAKKNVELVARIRAKARAFPHLEFVKVRGHAGVAENERCDALATGAVASARRRAP